MANIGVEQVEVGSLTCARTMTANSPCQLNDRAHGRGFDDTPVIVMIAANFRDRRRQHYEYLILFCVVVE